MRTIHTLIIAIALPVALSSCGGKSEDKKTKLESLKQEQSKIADQIKALEAEIAKEGKGISDEKTKEVGVKTLNFETFKSYVDIQGRLDADENVTISPQSMGTVSKILVSVGDHVSKGQTLVELENNALRQGVLELQGTLDFATNMYNRQKNLWDQKIGTEVQFLTAKNQKESLEKKMSTLKEQLEMTKIKSPINGVVDAMDLKLGQAVAPGIQSVRVINATNLKVKAEVGEAYAQKINKGDASWVILPDAHDTIRTTLSYAAKTISPLSRSFSVEAKLNQSGAYRPNMVAILKIVDYANPKAFIVPVSAIQHSEDGDFIFIAESARAKKVHVKVGKTYNGQTEILSGLKQGDKLITVGYQDLNEGQALKYN